MQQMQAPAPPEDHRTRIHPHMENSYAELGPDFALELDLMPVRAPRLLRLNEALATELGFDLAELRSPEGLGVLAGNNYADHSNPVALAYAGHQFGSFVPQLGDGRALLLGEVITPDGRRLDVQLKGSGPTPFSRQGDGRAALGPVLREYLVSEAMHALGIPTTRALAAVATGEEVMREQVLPGGIFTRIASSHLRIGSFQYFAAHHKTEALQRLVEYALKRHAPNGLGSASPALALLGMVIERQARLVAQWMCVGFIHGVMNTDNTSIAGETIDYGPCAFMDSFNPATVFSYIDRQGRYAYGNQPQIALWNLTRLAEALLPLLLIEYSSEAEAIEAASGELARFGPLFAAAQLAGFRAKLGLVEERAEDAALVEELLNLMAANKADFTLTFYNLSTAAQEASPLTTLASEFHPWAAKWRTRLQAEATTPEERAQRMKQANPRFIPRNHLVEEALEAAVDRGDLAPFEALLERVTHPFDASPGSERYEQAPQAEQQIRYTYCGT